MTWKPIDLSNMEKEEAYRMAESTLTSLMDESSGIELDEIAFMSTLCSLIMTMQKDVFWVGFYRVVKPGKLLIGPYQGTPGCLEIDFSRGVCGRAATEGKTIIVDDVHKDPQHIACDARSRAEIVLPVFGSDGDVRAVLDLDSETVGAFDERDEKWLSRLLKIYYP